MTTSETRNRVTRSSHLKWVPIALTKVSDRAQREFRQSHADMFAADFDLEALGFPVVNYRDGSYYIIDGQHRIAALKMIGWSDQQIQCECYEDLTDPEMAELFLRRDSRRAINTFDKFRIGVVADRAAETDIDRIVRAQGLRVSREKSKGIRCVGVLGRVYHRDGPGSLARALGVIRDVYGDAGFEAPVIDGFGLLCNRYNGQLDLEVAVPRLYNAHGGVKGLLNKASTLQLQTGQTKANCVAAAAVDIINAGRGRNKLTPWFNSAP